MNSQGLDELVERIDGKYMLPECHLSCIRYMLACLGLLEGTLSCSAREALNEARLYWAGRPNDMANAKAKCVRWIREWSDGSNVQEDCGIRAVMHVLEPDASRFGPNLVEELDWFHIHTEVLGDIEKEQIQLLQQCFPAVNEGS